MAQARVDRHDDFDLALVEQQLEQMERPPRATRPILPWLLVTIGLVAIVSLGVHAFMAYSTIDRINSNSKIATPNPALLFQDVATNGPRVGSTVEASSRSTYNKALEQFVLDGTIVLVGLVLVMAGVFVRVNQ